ncbi:MAG: SDR family oxidoreductase [Acidimicrobiia bacterium]|nr:SDR family oxidoreductase [Acidimicrobiia bacterium]
MELRLDDKVAVITGGSRGIGKAIAEAFAQAGAAVMIVSRTAEALEQAAAQIGHGCQWISANVGDTEAAEAAIAETIERLGSVDVLVNNAATNPYAGPMIDVDLPRWEKTMQVNLTAPLVWTQRAWRAWMSEHGGSVVNVASVAAVKSSRLLGVYGVSKAALVHQSKQLAAELAPKVRVNTILPGLIKTDFARVLWEGERGAEVAETYPLKRLGETEDIARAALYLASDASSWMTGQEMILDGGGTIAFGGE